MRWVLTALPQIRTHRRAVESYVIWPGGVGLEIDERSCRKQGAKGVHAYMQIYFYIYTYTIVHIHAYTCLYRYILVCIHVFLGDMLTARIHQPKTARTFSTFMGSISTTDVTCTTTSWEQPPKQTQTKTEILHGFCQEAIVTSE